MNGDYPGQRLKATEPGRKYHYTYMRLGDTPLVRMLERRIR
jgi:hypothetical protein